MNMTGHIRNGVVVLEGKPILPEGAVVTVTYRESTAAKPSSKKERIQLPLIRADRPGRVLLTGAQISEILDEEDASPRY